jgi:hypothetical protein
MDTLATRFPADLTHAVFFDTTVFVTATIEEVIRTRQYSTLREAGRSFDQLERQLAAPSLERAPGSSDAMGINFS